MSLVRMIPSADYSTRQGKWEKSKFNGIEITNKILGLVGCGNVGSIVANRAIGLKMKVIYLGHSCFLIFFKGKKLLIDPFISGNELAKKVDISGIKCHYILITHGHQDHMLDAELIANNNNATIISNYEIVSWFQTKGLNGHGMNHGGKFNFDFGYKLLEFK